jgi:hypothetical protein
MLTRAGRGAVVVVDPESWAKASAALEAVENAADLAEYHQAMTEWDGTTISHEELLAELEIEGAAEDRQAG